MRVFLSLLLLAVIVEIATSDRGSSDALEQEDSQASALVTQQERGGGQEQQEAPPAGQNRPRRSPYGGARSRNRHAKIKKRGSKALQTAMVSSQQSMGKHV
eukprot:TRINITY_DN28093_c0_g1_i1.p1 TRINITY_DN28093_c0_g1~~TRINITY_DN28093_c0_g1_i1.p1  ORF type:complete len:101 (+),score=12.09 TRINITY_DN28093_c0_g1_i1:68-370(+)